MSTTQALAMAVAAMMVLTGSAAGLSSWTVSTLTDLVGSMLAVAVGDGDGDEAEEVYALHGKSVHRFSWDGTAWQQATVATLPVNVHSLAVGDGDRDGSPEVYVGRADGRVHEYAWSGSTWTGTLLPALPGATTPVTALVVGDGDDDGALEVYAGAKGRVFKLSHGSSWTAVEVANLGWRVQALVTGDGDRDGRAEVWAGTANGEVWRVVRGPNGWIKQMIGVTTLGEPVRGLALGDANNDSKVDVYAGDKDNQAVRFAKGQTWVRQVIAAFGSNVTGLVVGKVRTDTADDVYVTTADGHVHKVWWDGTWIQKDVATTGQARGLSYGEARNDGRARLYEALWSGEMKEVAPDWTNEAGQLAYSARGAAAAYDGRYVFIFGGGNQTNVQRFDPLTNQTTLTNASIPSLGHAMSAVWTGSFIYTFGGSSFGEKILKFDTEAETLTEMATKLPSDRQGTSAVWDGTYAYIFGGLTIDGDTDQILRYDPLTDNITVMNATLPSPRSYTSAVWAGEEAFVFGGRQWDPTLVFGDIVRYVPANDESSIVAAMPDPLWATSAAWNGTRAFVFGGCCAGEPGAVDGVLRFDPSSASLAYGETGFPSGGIFRTAAAMVDGRPFLFGGTHGIDVLPEIVEYLPS